MKAKTKKLTYLTAGLTGALAASAVVGSALSSCTVTASNSTNGGITLPDSWYNKDINWNDSTSLNNLLIDDQGLVYSSKYMTEIIAVLPGYGGGTITVPASVKTISGYYNVTTDGSTTTRTATGAFEGLTSLTTVVFAGKNVTQIGAQAFKGCTSLQTISLPSSITLIADSAFENCTSLSSINLSNVQYIGTSAFSGAFSNVPYGSVSLDLNKASYIGASAFANATGIKSADLSKNTVLTTIGSSAFINCTYLTGAINIANDKYLVTIGDSAFSGCTGITNVYLSDSSSLKTIGASAFADCTNLVSIGASGITSGFIIPSTVTSIGASAFANTLIAKIDLSQNTATNPLLAFALKDMTKLASVDLGTSITTLNEGLFENTPELSDFDLVLPSSITTIATANGTKVGSDSYTASSYSAFYNSGFKSIDLSNISSTATDLGYGYFEDCSNLQTIKLKSTITQIKFRAFYNCSSLKTVTFVSSDSASVAADTTGFVAPAGLTFLGSYAFYNTGLETIDLSAVTTDIMGDDNYGSSTSNTTNRFANSTELTTIKLPSATTTIPRYNFYNTPKLKSVNFDQLTNLTSIYNNNFAGTAFTEIDLSSTKLSSVANENCFTNLTNQATIKLPATLTAVADTNFTYLQTSTDSSTSVALPLTYPNGFGTSDTTNASKILSSSTTSSSTSLLARVSGDLDFSNFTNFNGIGQNTAFGNTSLTGLKFAASTFAAGQFNTTPSSGSLYTALGFIGTGITEANTDKTTSTDNYATGSLPFGNMSGLKTIEFNSFTSTTATEGVMAKTTSDTWDEVVRIMNSFAKSSLESESNNESDYVANLSDWDSLDNNVKATITYSGEDSSQVVQSVTLSTSQSSSNNSVTISDSSVSGQILYSGVTWTISLDTTNSTITITAQDVDTYRAVVGSSSSYTWPGYKVFFNTTTKNITSDSTTKSVVVPDSNITVTLNVVTTSTN